MHSEILTVSRVLAAAASQLALFHQEIHNSATNKDLTLGYWRSALCNQVMQCLAIVTICLPYTRIFMESFESGLVRVDDGRRRGELSLKESSGGDHQLMHTSRSSQSRPTDPARSIKVSRSWDVSIKTAEHLQNP